MFDTIFGVFGDHHIDDSDASTMNIPFGTIVNITCYEQIQFAVYGSQMFAVVVNAYVELCFGSFHDGPHGSALGELFPLFKIAGKERAWQKNSGRYIHTALRKQAVLISVWR